MEPTQSTGASERRGDSTERRGSAQNVGTSSSAERGEWSGYRLLLSRDQVTSVVDTYAAILSRMRNRLMHALNGNVQPKPKSAAGNGVALWRQRKTRINAKRVAKASGRCAEDDASSSVSSVQDATLGAYESDASNLPDRPRNRFVPTCTGLHTYRPDNPYCEVCGEYNVGLSVTYESTTGAFEEFHTARGGSPQQYGAENVQRVQSLASAGRSTGGGSNADMTSVATSKSDARVLPRLRQMSRRQMRRVRQLRCMTRRLLGVDDKTNSDYVSRKIAEGQQLRTSRAMRRSKRVAPPRTRYIYEPIYDVCVDNFTKVDNDDDTSNITITPSVTGMLEDLFYEDPATPPVSSAEVVVDSPRNPLIFSESRKWWTPVAEYIGYRRDIVEVGTVPTTLRDLQPDNCGENYAPTKEHLERRLNRELYRYLMREKLPGGEYVDKKTGLVDKDLLMLHMHKLTKQFYSTRKMPDTEESLQLDFLTQSFVANETSKAFFLGEQPTSENKCSSFLLACATGWNALRAGCSSCVSTVTPYRKYVLAAAVVSVPCVYATGRLSRLPGGSSDLLTRVSSPVTAVIAQSTRFLNLPSLAGRSLTSCVTVATTSLQRCATECSLTSVVNRAMTRSF